VPLNHVGREGHPAEDWVLGRGVALGDQSSADLRAAFTPSYDAAEGAGQQLAAEADAQGRDPIGDCPPQQRHHRIEIRCDIGRVVRRLRAAEHNEPVVPAQLARQLRTEVRTDHLELEPGGAQPVAEAPGAVVVAQLYDEG